MAHPLTACPHGDKYCPCQEGDLCHYEGDNPWFCPKTGLRGCTLCERR